MYTRIADLQSASWNALIEENYTFLIGSGISIWKPSGLPNGQKLTDYVYEDVLGEYYRSISLPDKVKKEWFKDIPFEVVMDRCVDRIGLRNDLLKLYSSGKMNVVHNAVADYSIRSQNKFICTTNYDTGIEQAFNGLGQSINTVITRKEANSTRKNLPTIFKIHGTASEHYKDNMLFRLKQEFRMPAWKKKFLKKHIQGTHLIVIGYSGLDFEICPELVSLEPKSIIWNFYKVKDFESADKSSPGYSIVEAQAKKSGVKVLPLIGDMLELIGGVWGYNSVKDAKPDDKPIKNIFSISGEVKKLWAGRVLQAMGIGGRSLDLINDVKFDDIKAYLTENQFLKYKGRGHLFAGEYEDAKFCYTSAVEKATAYYKIDCLMALVNACINNTHLKSKEANKKELKRGLDYLELAAKRLKYTNRNFKAQFLLGKGNYFKRRVAVEETAPVMVSKEDIENWKETAVDLFSEAAKLFYDTGDYSDFNACWLFADQIGKELNIIDKRLLPSTNGFRHLGYKWVEIIEFRYFLYKKTIISSDEEETMRNYLAITKLLGMGEHDRLCELMDKFHLKY